VRQAGKQRLALGALVVLALLWGNNWVVMKVAVTYGGPFAFSAMRAFGGGVALAILALLLRLPLRPAYPPAYFWIGLFQTAGFLAGAVFATVGAAAGHVAVLANTMPLWVTLLAWPLLGERLTLPAGIAVAVAAAGVACMAGPRAGIGIPALCALGAGLSWAIGIVLTKRLQRRATVDVFNLTMWQMLFGGAVLIALALAVPERPTVWNAAYAGALAYNVIFATAIAYWLWTFALGELPARDASMATLANPVIGVTGSWIMLHEVPSPLSAIGMGLILAGLATQTIAERFRLRTSSTAP
jgi:drug/metabolite transporter (DMT)-like permease